MTLVANLKKYKILLFIIGALTAIVWGGKDSNFLGLADKSGKQILTEVEEGLVLLREVQLSEDQENEIEKLIAKNPEKYSLLQKALISKKSGKEILNEVGVGNLDASGVYLNFKQYEEIRYLITHDPGAYTDYQKSLIKEKSGEKILLEVGLGKLTPSSLKLTPQQHKEIKELLLAHPNKYSALQKSLIPEIKEELEHTSAGVNVKKITLSLTGKEILNEVGNGHYSPEEIKLTEAQYQEIKELLLANPGDYNKQQKKLIDGISLQLKAMDKQKQDELKKIHASLTGAELLEQIGMGILSPDQIELTSSQLIEIKDLIKNDPASYNANQKSLIK